ncbi:MAG: aldo/keto reductase [Clostridia bacterium]|nr:aldo/keto reductase [Clostridia bacterium]
MRSFYMEGIPSALSALTYGTPGTATRSSTREQAFRSYDLAWGYGFRTFDTAHSYGDGEETLGAWLKSRGHRAEAVILDKGCNPGQKGSTDIMSGKTIREQMDMSLRRLQTDHVDLYLLHRDDPRVPVDEIVEELNRLKKEGKVLHFGGSNWQMERVKAASAYAGAHGLQGFSAVSPAYSLCEYHRDPWGGSVSLSGDGQADYRAWLSENRMPVFCYSPLGRGYLSGKFRTDGEKKIEECISQGSILEYDCPLNRERLRRAESLAREKGCTVSQVCLAWLLRQPQNIIPIVAPGSEEHIKDNVEALEITLTDAEADWLHLEG